MALSSTKSTLSKFINYYKSLGINHSKLFTKELLDILDKQVIVASDSILDPYQNMLKDKRVLVKVDDPNIKKYWYNPRKLSYDIYGTTELWGLILHANEIYSASEFEPVEIYLYDNSVIEFLQEVIGAESTRYAENAAYIKKNTK